MHQNNKKSSTISLFIRVTSTFAHWTSLVVFRSNFKALDGSSKSSHGRPITPTLVSKCEQIMVFFFFFFMRKLTILFSFKFLTKRWVYFAELWNAAGTESTKPKENHTNVKRTDKSQWWTSTQLSSSCLQVCCRCWGLGFVSCTRAYDVSCSDSKPKHCLLESRIHPGLAASSNFQEYRMHEASGRTVCVSPRIRNLTWRACELASPYFTTLWSLHFCLLYSRLLVFHPHIPCFLQTKNSKFSSSFIVLDFTISSLSCWALRPRNRITNKQSCASMSER